MTYVDQRSTKKAVFIYSAITILCIIIPFIYHFFAHGVSSPYMTFLALFPFILGVIPCMLLLIFWKLKRPGNITINIYNSGVAAITVSSLLRGIFEIAGTGSALQSGLMIFGIVTTAAGIILYFLTDKKRKNISAI